MHGDSRVKVLVTALAGVGWLTVAAQADALAPGQRYEKKAAIALRTARNRTRDLRARARNRNRNRTAHP